MITPRWFRLTIPNEMARKMTRKEYYAARSWLRQCERIAAAEMSNKLGQTQ